MIIAPADNEYVVFYPSHKSIIAWTATMNVVPAIATESIVYTLAFDDAYIGSYKENFRGSRSDDGLRSHRREEVMSGCGVVFHRWRHNFTQINGSGDDLQQLVMCYCSQVEENIAVQPLSNQIIHKDNRLTCN